MRPQQHPTPQLLDLAARQAGVLSTEQVRAHGLGRRSVDRLLHQGHWCRVSRGVLGLGTPRWEGLAWAGTLIGGNHSRLGGWSALHVLGLEGGAAHPTDADGTRPPAPIEVWVPRGRPVVRQGVDTWRFRQERTGVHSGRTFGGPPHLGPEDAVLDLAADLAEDAFVGLVLAVVQQHLTSAVRLRQAAGLRSRLGHRSLLEALLDEASTGIESPLEREYLHRVERAHGLPTGDRQNHRGRRRRDVVYPGLGLVVELDGRWHRGRARFEDMDRDNLSGLGGEMTLRYGWPQVVGEPCRTAAQVALALTAGGWSGLPTRCDRCQQVPTGELRAEW